MLRKYRRRRRKTVDEWKIVPFFFSPTVKIFKIKKSLSRVEKNKNKNLVSETMTIEKTGQLC